jgi:DNA-binding GntR family transcriptional regulator
MAVGKTELTREAVYQKVKKMILLSRFKPGLRLNVERLARELGVSRTPVWEAVWSLEREGLVQKVRNRGVFLSEASLARVKEQLQVLAALDKLAVTLACEQMTDTVHRKLSACLPDQLRAAESADLTAYGIAEMRFHEVIYEASGNSCLKEAFDRIVSQLIPSRFDWHPFIPMLCLAHADILEGFSLHDTEKALLASARHNEVLISHINEQMRAETERKEILRHVKEKCPSPGRPRGRPRKDKKVTG